MITCHNFRCRLAEMLLIIAEHDSSNAEYDKTMKIFAQKCTYDIFVLHRIGPSAFCTVVVGSLLAKLLHFLTS